MEVTVIQTDIKWNNPEANYSDAIRFISDNPKSDLYVLPEMWATGFNMSPNLDDLQAVHEDPLQWMRKTAKAYNCALCGSLAVKEENLFRNRFFFVHPNGTYQKYDKKHLFAYGGEDKSYTAGTERTIVQYKDVKFLLQVCYDLRFPVWMRNKNDYDAIILVANWPVSRQNAWQILIRARAIENQCYMIAANRVGKDPTCLYGGHSAIIDPKGQTIVQASNNTAEAINALIDIDKLYTFREKFPVLKDRDIL